MTGPRLRPGLLAAIVLATGGGLAAQPSQFAEAVRVELVLVDVLVTDRDGRPVLDLERQELRLFEDDQPVEIEQFSAPLDTALETGAAARSQTPGGAPLPRDRYVLFLDELHLGPGSRRRALDQLGTAIGRIPAGAEVQLVSFDGAVRIDLPFTPDRRRLRKALEVKLGSAPPAMFSGFAKERLLQLLPRALQIGIQNSFLPPDQMMEVICEGDLGPLVRSHAEQTRGRVKQTVEALGGFVASLGGFEGRKVLLHVSDGIPLIAGQTAFEHAIELCDGSLAQQGLARDVVPEIQEYPPAVRFPMTARLDLLTYNTAADWERLAADANTYGVTFYTLQASGLGMARAAAVDGARTSGLTDTVDRLNDQDTLFALANETGGRTIFNTNDFRPDFDRMVEDSGLRYEIAFKPRPSPDGRLHRLRVEATRADLRIRHRRSYRTKSDSERATDRLLTTLYHGRSENPHQVRIGVEAVAPTAQGKNRELVVELKIPMQALTLLPSETELHGQMTVWLVARDELGNRTGIGEKSIVLRLAPQDAAEEYVYRVSMALPRDHEYEVAAAVRDLLGGVSSYLTARVSL